MEKSQSASKKISVRLDSRSAKKLDEATAKGYTISQYINSAINGSAVVDMDLIRKLIVHVNHLQSQIEFEEDSDTKTYMRGELHQICLVLKSLQDHT